MKWIFSHITGENVNFYHTFLSVYNNRVRKVALVTWFKPRRALGCGQSHPSYKTKGWNFQVKNKILIVRKVENRCRHAIDILYNGHCSIAYNWESLKAT